MMELVYEIALWWMAFNIFVLGAYSVWGTFAEDGGDR